MTVRIRQPQPGEPFNPDIIKEIVDALNMLLGIKGMAPVAVDINPTSATVKLTVDIPQNAAGQELPDPEEITVLTDVRYDTTEHKLYQTKQTIRAIIISADEAVETVFETAVAHVP